MGLIFNGNGDVIKAVDGSLTVEGLDFDGGNVNAGIVTGTSANFTGNVSVGGVLTYEDVKNVDSVGVVTARAGIVVQGDSTFTGNSHNGYWEKSNSRFKLSDGGKVVFGDGADLQLHHTSNNSHIEQAGTGQLYFDGNAGGSTAFTFRPDKNEVASRMFSGGSVELYHNNVKKFETTSTGIDVVGAIDLTGTATSNDVSNGGMYRHSNAYTYFSGKSDGNGAVLSSGDGTATVFCIRANSSQSYIKMETGNGSEKLRIDNQGLVLIGTTSAGFAAYGDALTIYKSNHVGLTLRTDNNKDAAIYFADSASGNGRYAGFIDYSHTNNYLRFGSNETERLRIDSSGNLLLGTTTSIQKFTIDNGGISLDNGWNTQWGANASRAYIQGEDATGNNRLLLGTNNTERLRIDSAGHVMIGTTTEGFAAYGDQFTIANSGHCGMTIRSGTSSDGNIYFSDGTSGADEVRGFVEYNHTSNYMNLGTDGGWKLRITSTGNVGIGEGSPDNKLHVTTTTDTEQIKVENTASSGRAQVKFTSPHAEWVAGTLGGSTTGDFITYTANEKNARWYTHNTERLRLTSGGQLVQFTTHSTGNSAHQNTSWYGDDAGQYSIEIRDSNEMYAVKTINVNSYDHIIYKREKMTNYCDIEFTMSSAHDNSGSADYHMGMVINGDGSDTHSNFDRLVFRSNGGNTSTNQIRLDKGGGGSSISKATSSFPTWHDGTERHYQIKIRGRRFAIYVNGAETHVGYTNINLRRTHGYFGFQIYEASSVNPWVKVRDFKITNYTPSTGVPGWEVVFDTPASTNASSSFVIDNMDNPQTVEMRFWRLRHSGGNTNSYFRLGWQGSWQTSGYHDIAQYHNESGGWTASRGHNQGQGQPFHYDFTGATNYYSGVMTIRRVSSGGNNTGFVYNSNLVVDYDSGNTQYHIVNNGRVQFGNTNPWTKIQLYTNSGTNFNYGSMQVLAQY